MKALAWRDVAMVFAPVVLAVIVSEAIGSVSLSLGATKVSLFPFLWALLICMAASIAMKRADRTGSWHVWPQRLSSDLVQVCIMVFIAKLGSIVGANVSVVVRAGPVLLLQEIGNFLGTVVMAMPLALLLGIKREAIGATFSVGREPSVALIAERYGLSSAEGRGVMAEYVTGSIFGAAFMALFANLVADLNVFSPTALAMAAGIGSTSMTAAAVGAIWAHYPEQKETIATLAAASNLLTTVLGTYVLVTISLPTSNFLYARLEPLLGRRSAARHAAAGRSMAIDSTLAVPSAAPMPIGAIAGTLGCTAFVALLGNRIATGVSIADAWPGMAVLTACAFGGVAFARMLSSAGPALLWVSIIAMLSSMPFSPTASMVNPWIAKVGLLPLVTPVLALAGLSLARDLPMLKSLGWRIIVVSLVANSGAFLAGAIIAQVFGG